jgi:hypothetical protein
MNLTMYDSTNPLDIPADVQAVAGYLDLWPADSWDRFTKTQLKRYIARNVNEGGDTCDVETGDLTPAEAPVWTRNRIAAGVFRPWGYCNLNTKPALFSAMANAGLVLHKDWEWWSAGYFDGSPRLDPDAIATQYANPATSGGHFDLSLVSEDAFMLTIDEARALVRLAYVAGLGREPESEDVLAAAAADAQANGYEQMATRILDSQEGIAWRDHLHTFGNGPAHTHVTGPPQ